MNKSSKPWENFKIKIFESRNSERYETASCYCKWEINLADTLIYSELEPGTLVTGVKDIGVKIISNMTIRDEN